MNFDHTITKIKVIMIGKINVGKTCLVTTYMKGVFPRDASSTIGVAQNTRKLDLNGRLINLHIWDTAGAERYKSLLPIYSRGAHVALVCFDEPNLENIEYQINTIKKDNSDIHIILVATKMDSDFEYEHEDIIEYANVHGYDTICTSALKNKNVNETFELAAKKGIILADKFPPKSIMDLETKVIIDHETPSTSKKCCGSQ